MKKVLKLFFVLFLFLLCGGCAARRGVPIYFPQISSPAAERAGVAFYGTPFQVLNETPFSCRLIAGGKDLGVVDPGGLVYDQRHFHNLWYQYIPVAAVCYRDASPSEYVGAAGRVLTLGGNIPAEWVIRPREIRTPDGRPLRAPAQIASATTSSSRRIELPRETLSTVGIQIINNAAADVKIFINGRPVAVLGTGGVYHTSAEIVGNYSRPLIITITMGTGCVHTEQVWVNRYSQYARQIIFDAGLCGSRWR